MIDMLCRFCRFKRFF